jgi:hypothetical protein
MEVEMEVEMDDTDMAQTWHRCGMRRPSDGRPDGKCAHDGHGMPVTGLHGMGWYGCMGGMELPLNGIGGYGNA